MKAAKRWTEAEAAWARYVIESGQDNGRSIPEIIAGLREVRARARAKIARREAHIYRHGLASAQRYYTGI